MYLEHFLYCSRVADAMKFQVERFLQKDARIEIIQKPLLGPIARRGLPEPLELRLALLSLELVSFTLQLPLEQLDLILELFD